MKQKLTQHNSIFQYPNLNNRCMEDQWGNISLENFVEKIDTVDIYRTL